MIGVVTILVTLLVISILNNYLVMKKCPGYFDTPSFIDETYGRVSIDVYYKKEDNDDKKDKPKENVILENIKNTLSDIQKKNDKNMYVLYR